MIIGICGLAGVGKDTTADFLVKNNGFMKISLADPMKRICHQVYDFSEEQLWGPSEKRNEPDKRYLRAYRSGLCDIEDAIFLAELDAATQSRAATDEDVLERRKIYLTPRYALQQLGTEWGRKCYPNTWVDIALKAATHYLAPLPPLAPKGVVIPDVRFKNEVKAIQDAGGFVVRLYRPESGLSGEAGKHTSETELQDISDADFDVVMFNNKDLEHLETVTGIALIYITQLAQLAVRPTTPPSIGD